jgi:dTDP-4-dehydrorhamnose reductase
MTHTKTIKHILISGASGLLGLNLAMEAAKRYSVFGVVNEHPFKTDVFKIIREDLSTASDLKDLFNQTKPDAIINCAALANVDVCESNLSLARRLNADLAGAFAVEAGRAGTPFLHISTDAVFDGQRGDYSEEDEPNPTNIYSRTKYLGELLVSNSNPAAIIARINLFGWSMSGTRSLAEFFYNNLQAGKSTPGFTDVFFCPMLVNDLAQVLFEMLEKNLSGLYHVFSPQCISKYEFGVRIARRFGFDDRLVVPCTVEEGDLKAARSPMLTMNSNKVAAALGHALPDVDRGISGLFDLAQQGYPLRLRQMNV